MIALKTDKLTAHILPLGAALAGLWYAEDQDSLVLGSTDTAAYRSELTYCGAIVGPVANRIRNARFKINGHPWIMTANEGPHCLHGGPDGLHTRPWQIDAQTETAVTLSLVLAHGDCGLPGRRRITAQYSLSAPSTLSLQITATSDQDTVMNLAHHPYWSLDKDATVARHALEVQATRYLPIDGDTLPTGEVAPVDGSDYDFRTPRRIPTDRILDACLCLADARRSVPMPAARLIGASGRQLEIETTEPGLQVYNGAGLRAGQARLHPGQALGPYAAVALEPQGWPDAPNKPDFPSILLPAQSVYEQTTIYRIS